MVLISPRSTNKTNFFLLHLLIDNSNREHLSQIDITTCNNQVPLVNIFQCLSQFAWGQGKTQLIRVTDTFQGQGDSFASFQQKNEIAFCVIFIFAICRNLYNLYFSVEQTWSVVTNCTRKKSKKVKAAIIRIFYFLLMDEDFRACKRVFSEVFKKKSKGFF